MLPISRFFWSAAIVLCCSVSVEAQQIDLSYDRVVLKSERSLESVVLNGEAIVLGKIVAIYHEAKFSKVTLAVDEVLRGEHADESHFRLPSKMWKDEVHFNERLERVPAPPREGRLILVGLSRSPDHDGWTATGYLDLSRQKLRVWRADFTNLTDTETVLTAARETIEKFPGITQVQTFTGRGPDDYPLPIDIPVDERLEIRSQVYVHSKVPSQRAEGARALRFFKTPENIHQVMSLLKDPVFRYEDAGGGDRMLMVYPVREAAKDTLRYWGLK